MLARTDFWDNRELKRDASHDLLDTSKNADVIAVCLFAALGLLITIAIASIFPLNDAINLIAQCD